MTNGYQPKHGKLGSPPTQGGSGVTKVGPIVVELKLDGDVIEAIRHIVREEIDVSQNQLRRPPSSPGAGSF